jgi:hypothetical protein
MAPAGAVGRRWCSELAVEVGEERARDMPLLPGEATGVGGHQVESAVDDDPVRIPEVSGEFRDRHDR